VIVSTNISTTFQQYLEHHVAKVLFLSSESVLSDARDSNKGVTLICQFLNEADIKYI